MVSALRVMEVLADAAEPVAVTELAGRLELAPSTVHRILATLLNEGYAARVPAHRRYRVGPSMGRLARRTLLDHVRFGDAARRVLVRLAMDSGETSHLAVLDGTEALAIDHVESTQPVIAHHPIGSRVPAHATAVGQAILAHLPEVAARVTRGRLEPYTPRTITHGEDLAAELAEIRRRGYAINNGQLYPETAGVAAPVFDPTGAVIGSIGITGPSARVGRRDRLEQLAVLAIDGASEVARRLATSVPPDDGSAARVGDRKRA